MSNEYNEIDISILREQFPLIFIFEDMFTEEELKQLEELEK